MEMEDDRPGFYRIHYAPIHTIYLVKEVSPDRVVLASIEYDWLEEWMDAHPEEAPSVSFGTRRMLTASTSQLQKLLLEHREQFTHEIVLKRADNAR